MSWFFFTDESGHDHKRMPCEVRGGFAIHASEQWLFAQAMPRLEIECFGCRGSDIGKEIKGSTGLADINGHMMPDGSAELSETKLH